ncbi:MAG: DUF1998 domain-containing protein [Actinomycetota bacterium]|nr:DUF1998 domain-containing protein [Actinomycetota bacterium]MDA8073380.1 DUF1998 domain-containing protein [Actinomycetota bacterium]
MTPATKAAAKKAPPGRVGGVRPSQLMYTFGVGAMVDLPNFSVIVAGLDDWKTDWASEVVEERLLAAIRADQGLDLGHVSALQAAPWLEESRNPFEEWARTGVPVIPFPRWMRCTVCNLLTTVDAGLLELVPSPFRPDQVRYAHKNCSKGRGKPPSVVPARFVVACQNGHIDEFPWVEFTHRTTGGTCPATHWRLEARDIGAGARSTEMLVSCVPCGAKVVMTAAFGENATAILPRCRGRHAHLRQFDADGCTQQVRPMLLGASNAWFPATRTVLSIPVSADSLEQTVAECWPTLDAADAPVTSPEMLAFALKAVPDLKRLAGFDPAAVWAAIETRRAGIAETGEETDLLGPEWTVFVTPHQAPESRDFRLGPPAQPPGFAELTVVPAERLREVVALCGFTRVDGPDSGVAADVEGVVRYGPLARKQVNWVPAAEVRGEGVFVRLHEDAVRAWESSVAGGDHLEALREAHQEWRRRRGLTDVNAGWPGERYVLLHSLSHALVNELALECGYSVASIRERIYAREADDPAKAMAGVLLYTAAPDSEGTLGGLVALAEPDEFARALGAALERAKLCSSDPLCSSHVPGEADPVLHAAACHSCLFLPETSCERGNRYLDRTTMVETLAEVGIAFPFSP